MLLIWELFHLQLAPCPKYMHLVYISKKHRSIFLSMFFESFFENEDCKCCNLLIFLFPAWAQLKKIHFVYARNKRHCISVMFSLSRAFASLNFQCFWTWGLQMLWIWDLSHIHLGAIYKVYEFGIFFEQVPFYVFHISFSRHICRPKLAIFLKMRVANVAN